MVSVTLQFDSVDLAIVALGKLVGTTGTARGAGRMKAGVTDPSNAAHAATSLSTPPAPAPVVPASDKAPRKSRADKGQARGAYAPRQDAGTAAPANPAPQTAAPGISTEVAAGAPAVPPAPAAAATRADAERALDVLFQATSIEKAREVMATFSDGKGEAVQRLRDLPDTKLGAFVAACAASLPKAA